MFNELSQAIEGKQYLSEIWELFYTLPSYLFFQSGQGVIYPINLTRVPSVCAGSLCVMYLGKHEESLQTCSDARFPCSG